MEHLYVFRHVDWNYAYLQRQYKHQLKIGQQLLADRCSASRFHKLPVCSIHYVLLADITETKTPTAIVRVPAYRPPHHRKWNR
jgi:hypothetical protein